MKQRGISTNLKCIKNLPPFSHLDAKHLYFSSCRFDLKTSAGREQENQFGGGLTSSWTFHWRQINLPLQICEIEKRTVALKRNKDEVHRVSHSKSPMKWGRSESQGVSERANEAEQEGDLDWWNERIETETKSDSLVDGDVDTSELWMERSVWRGRMSKGGSEETISPHIVLAVLLTLMRPSWVTLSQHKLFWAQTFWAATGRAPIGSWEHPW